MFEKVSPNVKFVTGALAVAFAVDFMFPYVDPPLTGVSVRGECSRKVPKDRARLRLRVYNLDKGREAAGSRTLATYEKLVSYVKSSGEGLEVDTEGVSISEKREWSERLKRSEVVGIAAEAYVSVDGTDMQKVAGIMAGTGKFGDVLVESYGAYASREAKLEASRGCIAEASALARGQAEHAAAGAGFSIDRLVSAEVEDGLDGGGFRPMLLRESSPMSAKGAAGASPSIVHGDDRVSVVVNAVYGVY
ncbi:MAG: SIMPL domain-containing protein [Rickettsiales bacterium]|jgi:uncharacterized protein YggE|nr:SIMPL domain-containing protein [Rickettsiales bacterium]